MFPEELFNKPAVHLKPLSHWISGKASYRALVEAVKDAVARAPDDNDVFISAFGIAVFNVRYIEPHTFIFSGVDHEERETSVVCHYTQLVAHVVYSPKKLERRRVIGFRLDNE